MMKQTLILLAFLILSCSTKAQQRRYLDATFTSCTIVIDGHDHEPCWEETSWLTIDQVWLGEHPSADDFTGRFKVLWDPDYLYLLAEITDDVLHDEYADPLKNWWKDDCLEVFVDEDNSGGDHKHNYNAFAYHISIYHDVVDLGMDGSPHLHNDFISSNHTSQGNVYMWELRIPLYTDVFSFDSDANPTRNLIQGDTIGLSVAYCDNDGGLDRESFIGSQEIAGQDKNTSYKNADDFGAVVLISTEVKNPELMDHKNQIRYTQQCIMFDREDPVKQASIYDLKGSLIMKKQNPGSRLNITGLNTGYYILHLIGERRSISQKIVKE
jgi:hypothetical protein